MCLCGSKPGFTAFERLVGNLYRGLMDLYRGLMDLYGGLMDL